MSSGRLRRLLVDFFVSGSFFVAGRGASPGSLRFLMPSLSRARRLYSGARPRIAWETGTPLGLATSRFGSTSPPRQGNEVTRWTQLGLFYSRDFLSTLGRPGEKNRLAAEVTPPHILFGWEMGESGLVSKRSRTREQHTMGYLCSGWGADYTVSRKQQAVDWIEPLRELRQRGRVNLLPSPSPPLPRGALQPPHGASNHPGRPSPPAADPAGARARAPRRPVLTFDRQRMTLRHDCMTACDNR